MRAVAIVLRPLLACVALPAAGGSQAVCAITGLAAILDVCEATTLDEAADRGGRLGWPAAPEDHN
jgi:hypothetical protein